MSVSLNRDRYRRWANRVVRKINEEYWERGGRYYIHQERVWCWPLEDRSALLYGVELRFIDRATGHSIAHFCDMTYWLMRNDMETILRNLMERFIDSWETMGSARYDFRYYTEGGRTIKSPHAPHPGDAPIQPPSQNFYSLISE